jgi:hypothetical protein
MLALRWRFGALVDMGRIADLGRIERTDGHVATLVRASSSSTTW